MTGPASTGGPASSDAGRLVIRRTPGAEAASRRGRPASGFVTSSRSRAEGDDLDGDVDADSDLRQRLAELAPLALWCATLAAALLAFRWLGRTPLASPPVTDPAAWWAWAQGQTTDVLAFNLLRIVGVGLAWYLLGATSVGAIARLVRIAGLVRVADRLTIAPVRRLLQASLGLALATSATASLAGTPLPERPVVVQQEVAAHAGGPVLPVVPGAIGQETVTGSVNLPDSARLRTEASLRQGIAVGHDGWAHLVRAGTEGRQEAPPRVANPANGDGFDEPGAVLREAEATQVAAEDAWVVASGDHFWSMAEQTLAAAMGEDIGENDVHDYWERLVEVNRHRLVDPANPDLLLPGQVLVLPPTAS